jgi:hypothetical protein
VEKIKEKDDPAKKAREKKTKAKNTKVVEENT